jgi:hypothetical protein
MTSRRFSVIAAPLAAGLLAAGWAALYLYVLWREQEGDTGDLDEAGVWFIVASVGAAAAFLLLSSAVPSRAVRAAGLLASGVGLLGYAILASLSIGIFLLPAAILALLASCAALASLPQHTASTVRWTGVLLGLVFPGIVLVALAPA